ncbi:MAG: DUF2782 domain-containing protein [Candidatus Accumulibacter sp.]|jgi:hypothetical protein|nr:DUF2782 domain-containing protein [Accumulibacter sp.]
MRRLHLLLFALLSLARAPAWAQPAGEPPAPPDERPPALAPLDDSVEPQITIRQRDGEIVEEYRMNGRLYKIRVIPQRGEPYILVDHRGDGSFVPQEGPGTPGLSVPQWVIGTF